VQRPLIPYGAASVPLSTFSRAAFAGGSINFATPPQLEPFTRREQYRVTLYGDEPDCDDQLLAVVWDCDLMIACYLASYFKAGADFYGPAAPWNPNKVTFRQFAAIMAANGLRALAQKYYQSATQCHRSFRDHCWLANLSAVLAEDFYKAFVMNHQLDQPWSNFFAAPDLEISSFTFLWKFGKLAQLFGDAHTANGLKKALPGMGNSPCCAQDLDDVVATLTAAQKPLLAKIRTLLPFGVDLGDLLGIGPNATFKDSLEDALLDGLKATGMKNCYTALRQTWGK
jgi:hypothetical protein